MEKYTIEYHTDVLKLDVPRLSKTILLRIQKAVVEKLQVQPSIFGVPLRSPLQGYMKLRVGDYRIVFKVKKKNVYVIAMSHRKKVYTVANKRK